LRIPRVSICIPTYRQVDYLQETLRSVQVQDFEDYELIISDDSPDDTVQQLVASFGFDDRLRYYRNPVALGSPENWNAAVRYAQGDYIKIMHHDDRFTDPKALSAFVRLLDEQPDADFAFSASSAESSTGEKNTYNSPGQAQVKEIIKNPEKLFLRNIIGAPSATIYRNNLSIGYDSNLQWLVDVDFYIRVFLRNSTIAYTSECLIATTTNASHQITRICKNNTAIEMYEHLYLYQKLAFKIAGDTSYESLWFRLFEKYRIYSQTDLNKHGIKEPSTANILQPFFNKYRHVWLQRTPYRVYARLPDTIKGIIRFLSNR